MLSILLGASAHLHDPGAGHPEAPARVERLSKCLVDAGYALRSSGREASREELVTVHGPGYVDRVVALSGKAAELDSETRLGQASVKAALNAAGTALALADELVGQQDRQIFAVVRPPGHHAESASTSGYCVFNNVALAAERLRRQGLRICILDWDVHHGNGTESIFLARPDVLFVSIHSNRLFPQDRGDAATVGDGEGRGATVNVPLPAGAGLAAYVLATKTVILPAVRRFRPDVVLVSLGFDPRAGDPQGNLRLRTEDFEFIGAAISAAGAGSAHGRIGMLLEGGYNLDAIGPCALAVLRGLGRTIDEWQPEQATTDERSSIEAATRIHGLAVGQRQAIQTLTQDQLDALLRDGEFPESVRLAAPKVVVVMTQDWCGQWANMAAYLPDFAEQAAIFTVEYNRLPDFDRIMRFKEDVFGNQQVPYLRFYRDGKLVRHSNWLPRGAFAAMLGRG